jgi:hypothetical protein
MSEFDVGVLMGFIIGSLGALVMVLMWEACGITGKIIDWLDDLRERRKI